MRPWVLAPLAGCVGPDVAEPPAPASEWWFGGSFTPDHTREDVAAVCRILVGEDACEMGKSEPPFYGRAYPTKAGCDADRDAVRRLPRTARVQPCEAT